MAGNMFLKIKGIAGECKEDKHKDWIDVVSWGWGITQPGSAGKMGGAGVSSANVHDLTVTKPLDKSSPDLLLKCFLGEHYDEAILSCWKPGGEALEYLKVTMGGEVYISAVQHSGGGGDQQLETVSLNFAKVKLEYNEQNETGGVGAQPKANIDIKAGKKL